MGVLQAEPFVELDVLFDVAAAAGVLHADVVDVEIVACSDGADLIEQALMTAGAGDGVDHDIGIRQYGTDVSRNFVGDLLRLLEGHAAGHGDRDIGEVAASGAADADPGHPQYAVHLIHLFNDAVADPAGRGIEQHVDGLARQLPAHVHHDAGDHQRGNGIGLVEPGQRVAATQHYQSESKDDHRTGPDVGAKVQRVGVQGLAVILVGDMA